MTERKLRKMLRQTSALPKWAIAGTIVLALLLVIADDSLIKFGNFSPNMKKLLFVLILLLITAVSVYLISRSLSKLKDAQKNGHYSLHYLESNGLLQKAITEYNSDSGLVCRLDSSASMEGKIVSRANVFTDSFVFVMTDNLILPYQDITGMSIKRICYNSESPFHEYDMLLLTTVDEKEVPVCSFEKNSYSEALRKHINAICEHVRQKNPKCVIDTEIK